MRAGHVMLKLSTAALDGSSHLPIGTGSEGSSFARLQALPWLVRVDDGAGGELLGSIRRLADPANTRTRTRMGSPLIEVEWQPLLPWHLPRGKPVEVRLDVYLRPEIFDLRISGWHSGTSCFFDIWQLFDKIVPMAPIVECPRPPPVQGDAVLAPCGAATAPRQTASRPAPTAQSFTLAGLMRALESAGYEEMADPPGLQLELYPFQRQSLQWMVDRETAPGGLNALFWREHPSEGSTRFFYNAMAGELRAQPPPVVTGGFLCEEMGLGKTVEMCALILANQYTAAASAAGRKMLSGCGRRETKATLIVVPVVLLRQWEAEIKKCTGDRLVVVVHHGGDVMKRQGYKDTSPLQAADIVLTTYEVLRAEAPWLDRERCLLRMHWWRVVLDESQRVPKPAGSASAMTAIAKACEQLSRTHSWCMSGTPVGNMVDDLLGQLIFLGVEPYCSRGDNGDAFWEREVSGRWKAHDPEALEVVHDLLGQIMMRHSKAQTMSGPGGQRAALVPLPPKTEDVVMLPLNDPSERAVYGELERLCREDLLAIEATSLAVRRAQASGAPREQIEALKRVASEYRREDLLSPRDLQLAATHITSLNLDATTGLEKKLASRALRTPVAAAGGPSTVAAGTAVGSAALLSELLQSRQAGAASDSAAARLRCMLGDPEAQRCGLCASKFGAPAVPAAAAGAPDSNAPSAPFVAPRLTSCGHLFCTPCLKASGLQRGDDACPECATAGAGLLSSTRLHTPIGATSLEHVDAASKHEDEPSLPSVEAAPWDTARAPALKRLSELRVWRCDGAPCHDGVRLAGLSSACASSSAAANASAASGAADGGHSKRSAANAAASGAAAQAHQAAASERMERCVSLDVEGLHFCSMQCAEGKLKRALAPYCSVCKQEGHKNNDTYWEEREVWEERTGRYRTVRTEKFRHPQQGGQVTNVHRNAMGKITNGSADHSTVVSTAWPGAALRGRVFPNQSSACKALKDAIKADPSFVHGSRWQGDPLYPRLSSDGPAAATVATTAADAAAQVAADAPAPVAAEHFKRTDARLPCLSLFPPSAPPGAFLAHLDAAGAPRSCMQTQLALTPAAPLLAICASAACLPLLLRPLVRVALSRWETLPLPRRHKGSSSSAGDRGHPQQRRHKGRQDRRLLGQQLGTRGDARGHAA